MRNLSIAFAALTAFTLGSAFGTLAHAQSLSGSRASMQRQHQEALTYGYSFLKTSQEVTNFVNSGYLVKVSPNASMELHDVSFPYARPAIKLFIDRLSTQYRASCGEKLTVTSLTRPMNRQPANAASDSVHPTGMAVDLRIPSAQKCRSWLEKTLLSLEGANVLDVTRERHPAHYHVAVFSQSYESYVAALDASGTPAATPAQVYVVRRGDSLSRIATRTGTTVAQLRAANSLRGDLINVGQKLQIPGAAVPAPAMPAPVVASATNQMAAVSEVTHRVRRGDTLWAIANQYRTTVDDLRSANNLASDALDVGQVLQIGINSGTP